MSFLKNSTYSTMTDIKIRSFYCRNGQFFSFASYNVNNNTLDLRKSVLEETFFQTSKATLFFYRSIILWNSLWRLGNSVTVIILLFYGYFEYFVFCEQKGYRRLTRIILKLCCLVEIFLILLCSFFWPWQSSESPPASPLQPSSLFTADRSEVHSIASS